MTIEKPDLINAPHFTDAAIDGDQAMRQLVQKLVEDEMDATQAQNNDITLPERPFLTDILRNELARLEQSQPSKDDSKDLSTIKTDTPPPSSGAEMNQSELNSWIRCLDQVKIKLEYKQRQLTNLDILKTYGSSA